MTIKEFNDLCEEAQGVAESFERSLIDIFEAAFEVSARYATRQFRSAAGITAAATVWTPPPIDTLVYGLTEDDEKDVGEKLLEAAAAITAVFGAIGLTDIGQAVMDALADRINTNYEKAAYDRLKTVVTEAFEQGLSAEDTALLVRSAFTGTGPTTANMLAQTTLTTIQNERSLSAADQAFAQRSSPVFKEWRTRGDAKVRHAHATTEGQRVPLDQPFSVGGSSLMYPGDPSGPINLVAHCRCTLRYADSLTAAAPASLTPTMGMVAVYPRAEEAAEITANDAASLHCTLVFLGDVGDNADAITLAVGNVAARMSALAGTIGGVGTFTDNGDGYPTIALPDVKGLTALREAVVEELATVGVESPSEHGFLPHMTLAYTEAPEAPDMSVTGKEVHFDTLSFVIGDTVRVDYTLDGESVAGEEEEMSTIEQPLTAAITITIDDGPAAGGAAEEAAEATPVAWTALLAREGQQTEDLRLIEKGSLSWRDLPLTLMAMTETSPYGGHSGAEVAGRIDTISRADGEETNDINGTGVFSTEEYGQEIARLVASETLRGNSVDLAVNEYEYRNADTGEVLEGEALWDAFFSDIPILFVVMDGVILASTVCPTPAINGASIMVASGGKFLWAPPKDGSQFVLNFSSKDWEKPEADVLTAGAAGMAPLHPPMAWFENPRLDGPTGLTVTKEGHVYGHAALFDTCHIAEPHGPGICVPPPRSDMQYSVFHHGVVETAEGVDVPCGQITLGTTHAGSTLSWAQTIEHYEHSGTAVADVAAGEDRYGIWVSGGLRPDVPAEKVREMKAGALSGDWRQVINRGLEFLAALVVNVPGFPIPRPQATVVASAKGEEVVLSLVAAGMVPVAEEVEGMSRQEYLRRIRVATADVA